MAQTDTIVGLGARSDHVAPAPTADPARLNLTPEEKAVLACVGRVARVQEVIDRSKLSEPRTIAILLALRVKGVIVPAKVAGVTPPPEAPTKSAPPPAPAKIDTSALSEDVEIDPARRQEILELESRLESLSHFEILNLKPGASAEDAKSAFYELSRKFHPDRYYGKNLGSYLGRIEKIFKRLSEAQQVLTTPARRAEYLKANPRWAKAVAPTPAAASRPQGPPREKTDEEKKRDAERRGRFARHPYLAKKMKLTDLTARAKRFAEQEEFGLAYNELETASQIEPQNTEIAEMKAEIKRRMESHRAMEELKRGDQAAKIGDLKAALSSFRTVCGLDPKNARAAFKAAQTMIALGEDPKDARNFAQQAVDADPKKADYRVLLGEILETLGNKPLAEKHFEEALKLDPEHEQAKKHAKKWWAFK